MSIPSREEPTARLSSSGGVVFLHGIARTWRSFRRMQRAVEAAGFATLNLDYDSRRKALAQLADEIHPAIAGFRDEVGEPIHFVAHSMGGLLTRVYLAKYPLASLGRVVMLGTPNGGSEIADHLKDNVLYRAYFGPAGQQLTTRRDAATAALLPPPHFSLGIIAGNRTVDPIASTFLLPWPNDGRVSVRNTRLEGMTDHLVVGASHPWLVRHPRVIDQTIAFLRDGRFSAPEK
jgi:pimeloyl-ACP methyl ester carboxylesterase